MTDPYGTPSQRYQQIERRLGPDLFSFGELLRTCHPVAVPSEIQIKCGQVEHNLERTIPAIALRMLGDEENRFEIIAVYSNDPDHRQSGELQIPSAWLGRRVVTDLNADSRKILGRAPILVDGRRIRLTLEAG